jgi:HAD superfamily hydrolase (TIGR01490 family)
VELVLFDLDNTLLAGDSDYEWAQFLIERGVLDGTTYEARNDEFFRQYNAGTLDIHEFLDFQLAPLARYPRATLDSWHREFMDVKVRPMIGTQARALVAERLHGDTLVAIVTATNSFVTAPIACELGVANLIATEPEAHDGAFTGKVSGIPCFREGKVVRVEQWLAEHERPFESFSASWFYSDSHNDLALLERVTWPVAVDPDRELRRVAESRGWPVISLR